MLDFISGARPDRPVEPQEPDSFDDSQLHTREDYEKAWGDAFLEYICENIEVKLKWSGATGVNVVSGNEVDDPTMNLIFQVMVEGVSGGGTLTPPASGDPLPLRSKLSKLTSLVAGLLVTVPAEPLPTDVFTPPVISLKSQSPEFILSGGDNLKFVAQGYVDGEPDFGETLRIFCAELIGSIKSGMGDKIQAHHVVAATTAVVPLGYTGTLEIVSIS
jgi:hypothetical protein